jgi:hypothetical protein
MRLIKKVKTASLKRSRRKPSKFETTEHWEQLKGTMHRGSIKPGETEMIAWTIADKKKYRITDRRTIARFLQRYIDKHKLPYRSGILTEEGVEYVTVAHQED